MDPAAARAGLLKLAPVVKTKEGGACTDGAQAKAWRTRRKTDGNTIPSLHPSPSVLDLRPPMTPEKSSRVLNLTRPSTEPGRSRDGTQFSSPGALSLLKKTSTELFQVWDEDPKRNGRPAPLVAKSIPVRRSKRRPKTADDVLEQHSRHLFRPIDDKCRQIGTLPMRERLFLFYKRFARHMLGSVAEIALYWKDDEEVFERLLASKYGSTMEEEGFGRTAAEQMQMQELQEEMREYRTEMSPEVRPREEWIPQNARPVSPLALRDAFLLSEAQVSAPAWELDENVRDMFMRPETALSSTAESQQEIQPGEPEPENEELVLHKVALSLNEQVVAWQPSQSRPGSVAMARTPNFSISAEQSRLATPVQLLARGGIIPPHHHAGGDVSQRRPSTSPGIPTAKESGESKTAWKEVTSSTHGKSYWYNKATGESRWLPPVSSNILVIESRPTSPHATSEFDRRHAKHHGGHVPEDGLDSNSERNDKSQLPASHHSSIRSSTQGGGEDLTLRALQWPELETATESMEASNAERGPAPAAEGAEGQEARTAPRRRAGMMLYRNFLPSSLNNVLVPNESPARRRQRKAEKSAEIARLSAFAVKIQACARGWLCRMARQQAKDDIKKTLQGVMASKIQNWFLGWLHHKQQRERRRKMKASGFTIYMAHAGVARAGKMWLSRTRERVRVQQELAAALKIQKHFRGMMVLRAFRKQQREEQVKAALQVQRAWRRQKEWQLFVQREEKKAIQEADRLRKQYLYAGKTAKQAREFRAAAEEKFEEATTDLGRSKAEAKLEEAHGRAAAEISSFGMWMATLRALMKQERGGDGSPAGSSGAQSPASRSPTGLPAAQRRSSAASIGGGIRDILGYSKLTNPVEVDHAIGEQRHGGGLKLNLVGMKLLRFPFGVSDRTKGGQPWFSLRTVWISNNQLSGLPDDFYALTNLSDLRMDRNQVESLSGSLGKLTNLTTLWMHSNLLTGLPPEVGLLTKLTFVSLYDNKIRSLPFEICELRELRKLPMYGNPDCRSPPLQLAEKTKTTQGLVDIMRFTGRFKKAYQPPFLLDISAFGLHFVPEINRVHAAQKIDMSNNMLSDLPVESFFDSKFCVLWHNQLTSLCLAGNQFTTFPMTVVMLTMLKHLDLRNNKIPSIPVEITDLQKLIELEFEGNPLVSPPFSVLADGVETFEVSGCTQNPLANGLFYKTDGAHDGTHVYELRKTHKREDVAPGDRLLLFYCESGWRQGWYIGRETAAASALVTVNDNAARPAAVSSTWKERSSEGIAFRAANVRVKGLGLIEYLARLIALRQNKAELTQMLEQYQVSEMLYGSGSAGAATNEAIARRREMHTEITRMRQTMTLDMSHLSMSAFPAQIADSKVRFLQLDGNHLEDVAPAIVEMPLTRLSIRFNALSVLPSSLRRLTGLVSLSLDRNCLSNLPNQLSRLHGLRTLLVSANLFQQVPDPIQHMTALRLLDLTHNYIDCLPSTLSSLVELEDFRIRLNLLTDLNSVTEDEFRHLKEADSPLCHLLGLTALDLDGNKLQALPNSLRSLTLLSKLYLGRNQLENLQDITQTMRAWANLQVLELQHNSVVALPSRLEVLCLISTVDLSSNGLATLPPGVASLPNLKDLSLQHNFLKWLPSEVGRLTSLTRLDVSHNTIIHVAADIRLCTCLEALNLANNSLSRLPPQMGHASIVFGKLKKLASLDIRNNDLVTLPPDLLLCSSLTSLEAAGNSFSHHALVRALLPSIPVGLVRLTIHEASEVRALKRSARANPLCRISTHRRTNPSEAAVSSSGSQLGEIYGEQPETTSKSKTDSPVWEETIWIEVNCLEDTIALTMHDKKEDGGTPELGYSFHLPAAFPVLDDVPFLHALGDTAILGLAREARQLVLAEGQDLAAQGDDFLAMVVVVHGKLAMLQRNEEGVERVVAEIGPGSCVGESCLVEGESLQHSLQAVSPSLLLVIKHEALSPALARDPELLIPLVLWTQVLKGRDKVHMQNAPAKKAAPRARRGSVVAQPERQGKANPFAATQTGEKGTSVWGSKEWEKEREKELEEIRQCIASACTMHALENNAYRVAVGTLEKRAQARMDQGGNVYHNTPKPPAPQSERSHLFGLSSVVPDKYGMHTPSLAMTVAFKAGSTVTPHMQALRAIEREGGDDGQRRKKAVHMDNVRNTPTGLIFETDYDELKADDLVRRVDDDMQELQVYKRSLRIQPAWEAVPRMLMVGSVLPREPWDGALDRNRHQAINAFSGMSQLLCVMHTEQMRATTDPRPKHSDTATSQCSTSGVWRQVEAGMDANHRKRSALGDATGGKLGKLSVERKVYGTVLDAWAMVFGLLLSKPDWIRRKELSRPTMELQDLQLAMVREQQEIAGLRETARWLKKKMQSTLADMEGVRATIRTSEAALRVEWNGPAFAQFKAATAELELMRERFDQQRQERERVKTMYVMRGQSGAALRWRTDEELSKVLQAFRGQENEFLDPIGACANVQGGEIEEDMLEAIDRADYVSAVNSMSPADVRSWAASDSCLGESVRIQTQVVAILERFEIDGRMLMHLEKDDLLRMGLSGPDSRVALVALAGFKRRNRVASATSRAHATVFRLNMQVALLDPDVKAIRELLSEELELEPKQLEGLRKAFMKKDRERTGEVLWKEAVHAAASLGIEAHPRRLADLKSTLEPSEAHSLDLVSFCRLGKALLSSASK